MSSFASFNTSWDDNDLTITRSTPDPSSPAISTNSRSTIALRQEAGQLRSRIYNVSVDTVTNLCRPFHECSTFGVIKKGVYHPASDFSFKILAEVISNVPSSSGYLVDLTTPK